MKDVLEFLKDCKVFYVATIEGDQPKVRPFGFIMEHEGKLYFTTNETKPSFKQMKANPNIEICATNAKNDWIRVSGKAVFDTRAEVKEKVFESAPFLKDMYGSPSSPSLAIFYIEDGEASFCSMSGANRVVRF